MGKFIDKILKFYETFLHVPVMILAVVCLFLNMFIGNVGASIAWGLIIGANVVIYIYTNYVHNGKDDWY